MKRFLIIAGSEKCGTTSLYAYLRETNQFNPSIKKETDYFRNTGCGLVEYKKLFVNNREGAVYLESSPGYLTCSNVSAENIKSTLDDVRIVFVFRDPTERFISSFNFHKSKYNLPESLDLDTYYEMCLNYYENNVVAEGIDPWFLDVLGAGKYYERLQYFIKCFDAKDMLFVSFNSLSKEPKQVLESVMKFSGSEIEGVGEVDFSPKNVGFSAKSKALHKIAMHFNRRFEAIWLKYPRIKSALLQMYKIVNKSNNEDAISKGTLSKIEKFYSEDQSNLNIYLKDPKVSSI
ncbi:sulfotransferase domain-containing protein [Marinobacter hydrocarbonoclasticus]|nr:sulfotransferase domain-containing protein [Marinobacter nauticus]